MVWIDVKVYNYFTPTVKQRSLNHWTARKVHQVLFLMNFGFFSLASGGPPKAWRMLTSSICWVSILCTQCTRSCPPLWDPMACSPPGSSVHGSFKAKYWSELPVPTPEDLPHPGMEPESVVSLALAGRFFTTRAPSRALRYCYVCPLRQNEDSTPRLFLGCSSLDSASPLFLDMQLLETAL